MIADVQVMWGSGVYVRRNRDFAAYDSSYDNFSETISNNVALVVRHGTQLRDKIFASGELCALAALSRRASFAEQVSAPDVAGSSGFHSLV